MAAPLAIEQSPSAYPLVFTDLVSFYRDAPPLPLPASSGAITELPLPNFDGVVNAKGIDCTPKGLLIVSLAVNKHVNSQRTSVLKSVDPATTERKVFSSLRMMRGLESKLVVVPATAPGGFNPGDVFVSSGSEPADQWPIGANKIAHVSADGKVVNTNWANPDAGSNSGLWGGLAFDHLGGKFSGQLIVLTLSNKIYSYDKSGKGTLVVDLSSLNIAHPEGLAVAPASFGKLGGNIVFGVEGDRDKSPGGSIYAVDSSKSITNLADIHSTAESLVFVPPFGGTFYLCQTDFYNETGNCLLQVTSAQFLTMLGQLIAVNEMSGEVWKIGWNGVNYFQAVIARAPGRWTSESLSHEGTEFESCCFAAVPPTVPTTWSAFIEVNPGAGFTTDQPVAATSSGDKVYLIARADKTTASYSAGQLYQNTYTISKATWSGWVSLSLPFSTSVAPAAAMQADTLYVFAVNSADGAVHWSARVTGAKWSQLSGIATSLAPSAALVNGWLVVCVKNSSDGLLYMRELRTPNSPTVLNQQWNPNWVAIPESGNADNAPAIAGFQADLYVFKVTSQKIYAKARVANGAWTYWGELPVGGLTNAAVAAAGTPTFTGANLPANRNIYLFIKGLTSGVVYLNMASETGTWSDWQKLPGRITNQGLAACVTNGKPSVVHLFLNDGDEKRIYWRHT